MNYGSYIFFSQLLAYVPKDVFDRIVKKHKGNKYIKVFPLSEPVLRYGFRTTGREGKFERLGIRLDAPSIMPSSHGYGKHSREEYFGLC